MDEYLYDVALSFASEDKDIVELVYKYLCSEGLNVFYSPHNQAQLAGKNRSVFYEVFRYQAHFVVAFVSKDYVCKDVPMQEASAAIIRNLEERTSCLIPIYLDGTTLPRLPSDVNYIKETNPVFITSLIKQIVSGPKNANTTEPDKTYIEEPSHLHINSNVNYGKQIVVGKVDTINM